MPSPSHRPTYDIAHLTNYLIHINLPLPHQSTLREFAIRHQAHKNSPPPDLANLTTARQLLQILQQHQLAAIPFENLALHYSPHHTVSLAPDYLYDKIVTRGRGGYCMENNAFFGTVLRSLGFRVYSAGARVHQGGGQYTPWTHMVNIVTLSDGKRYIVDVGFGSNGPTGPLLLRDGCEERGIGEAKMRLLLEKLPACTDEGQRLWIYQHRAHDGREWAAMYCFTETEFLPSDYDMMSFWTSQSRKSWFTYQVVVVKMVMDEGHQLIGEIMLTGEDVRRRVKGESSHLRTCRTEEERVAALAEIFDIILTEEEKDGIRGMSTELRG